VPGNKKNESAWDVRNVTTLVGLRAYAAKSNILPEQTLGRGLLRMYPGDEATEYLSVVGTDAFMDFVESIQSESEVCIVETKGLEDLDVPLKMQRLKEWCSDINAAQRRVRFDYVFVEEKDFETYKPETFGGLMAGFRKYKE